MSSRQRRTAAARPRINRRFPRPNYRPPTLPAPSRRIFPRRLDRPAFKRGGGARTVDSMLRLGIGMGLLGMLALALALFESSYADRINPHISVGGIPMGGVTVVAADASLRQQLNVLDQQPITLQVADRAFQVSSAQFHVRYNIASALAAATADGHNSDLITNIWNQVGTILQGHDYPLSGSYDKAAIQHYIARLNQQIQVQPLPAVVGVRDHQVMILREPVAGRQIDQVSAGQVLSHALTSHNVFQITIPVQATGSPISHNVAQAAVDNAAQLLSQPTYFSTVNHYRGWFLTPRQLVELLTFKPVYNPITGWAITMNTDRQRLRKTMAPIAAAVNHPPIPATFIVAAGNNGDPDSAVPEPGDPGLAIDIDRTGSAILAAASTNHTVNIPLLYPQATFDLAAARALALDTEMGKGLTNLATSSATRIANAHIAANMVSNYLLAPGKVFSLRGVLGHITSQQGYKQDLNRIGPHDISGINGGVVQVASALFHAAYDAGLPIKERVAYPFLTAFNGAPGTDALIVSRTAGPDLQFVNNTSHVILIDVTVDQARVIAYLFNNSAAIHYTVKVQTPVISLNDDGSVDATLSRGISGNVNAQDSISSHYGSLDQYP